jgi:hypothetical protein
MEKFILTLKDNSKRQFLLKKEIILKHCSLDIWRWKNY